MIETTVRKYFGFMYSFLGRTVFLFFMGTFCIGLKADFESLGIIIGCITFVNALLNCYVMYAHGEIYTDPTQKYTTAESASAQYVQSNPELAQQAFGAGAAFAASNPQLAQQGVNAAANYARENPDQAAQAASAYGNAMNRA
mmetsp:Transcript_24851/g.30402  ORF Transcript_24851/g.30402 Transcript_24851/m.30402 type:complete len:142 (-) Transcript_24851:175-600(-)